MLIRNGLLNFEEVVGEAFQGEFTGFFEGDGAVAGKQFGIGRVELNLPGQNLAVARGNDKAVHTIRNDGTTTVCGDHGQAVGHGLELGDGEAVGKGREDKHVGLAIPAGSVVAEGAAMKGNVPGGRGHGFGGNADGTDDVELDVLVLQEARGFDEVLDAFAKYDLAQVQHFHRRGWALRVVGRVIRGLGIGDLGLRIRWSGIGLVTEGQDEEFPGRDALLDESQFAVFGVDDDGVGQGPFAFAAQEVFFGDVDGIEGPAGPAFFFLADEVNFDAVGVHLIEDAADAAGAGVFEGFEGAGVVGEEDAVGAEAGGALEVMAECAGKALADLDEAEVLAGAKGAWVGLPGAAQTGFPGKGAPVPASDGGVGELGMAAAGEGAEFAGAGEAGKGVDDGPGPVVGVKGLETSGKHEGAGDGIVFAGANLGRKPGFHEKLLVRSVFREARNTAREGACAPRGKFSSFG